MPHNGMHYADVVHPEPVGCHPKGKVTLFSQNAQPGAHLVRRHR